MHADFSTGGGVHKLWIAVDTFSFLAQVTSPKARAGVWTKLFALMVLRSGQDLCILATWQGIADDLPRTNARVPTTQANRATRSNTNGIALELYQPSDPRASRRPSPFVRSMFIAFN